jgi:hypothetical protein
MQGILRTWTCQNRRCGAMFDAWDDYPPCPSCGCARTNWMPNGGHIGKAAPGIDAELKTLATNYGMTDIASARAGERAMPKAPTAAPRMTADMMQFAPGFVGTPYTLDAQGRPQAVCQPSAANVNFKVTVPTGQKLSRSGSIPGPGAGRR